MSQALLLIGKEDDKHSATNKNQHGDEAPGCSLTFYKAFANLSIILHSFEYSCDLFHL